MSQIYIGDTLVQVWQEEPFVINKESAPLEQIENRQGDYTKTFGIVGNEDAHKVFSNFFNSNVLVQNLTTENFNPDFNPNLKADISVWDEDDILFRGYCKLDEITRERDMVIYHCTAFSGLGGFGEEIGEKRVVELDLSTYDHTLNNANVSGSWTADYTNGYVYPMIKYGQKLTPSDNLWTIYDLFPAVYVRTILDKIFEDAGWSYNSTFLTSSNFNKLIVLNSQGELTHDSDTINDWSFTVANPSTYTISNSKNFSAAPTSASRFQLNTDTGALLDNALQNTSTTSWDTTNYVYTVPSNSKMAFRWYFDGDLEYNGSTNLPFTYMLVSFALVRRRAGVNTVLEKYQYLQSWGAKITTGSSVSLGDNSNNPSDAPMNFTTQEHDLLENDEIYFVFLGAGAGFFAGNWYSNAVKIGNGDVNLDVDAGSIFGNILSSNVLINNTITIQRSLPDMTQREFLLSLSQMFNLYYEQTEENELTIEPRDSGFYTSDTLDWSQKLDLSQQHKVTPVSELNFKEYHFSYSEDEAAWNGKYRQAWGEEYGSRSTYVATDFQTEIKEVTLPFASSVLTNDAKYSNRVVTDISFVDDDGNLQSQESAPRIVFYGGMIECTDWNYIYDGFNTTTLSTYPYAGHLDNPITPNWDFHFYQPKNIYYQRLYGGTDYPTYPNRNLYNKYYWRHIKEITSPNSRVFEGMFSLTKNDFAELSFRKKYFFENQTWRLIEVKDFDVTGANLTYCRFLLTDDIEDPTFDRYKMSTGRGEEDDNGDPLPFIYKSKGNKDNKWSNHKYAGKGNLIGGESGVLRGSDDNLVQTDVSSFMLLGSNDNNILSDNAVLINTDNRDVESFGEVWINDINHERYVEITLDNTEINDLNATPIQFLPTLESNQYYDLTRATYKYEENGTAYTGDGNIQFRYSTSESHPLWHNVGAWGTKDYVALTSSDTSVFDENGLALLWDSVDHVGIDISHSSPSSTITADVSGTYSISGIVAYESLSTDAQAVLEIQVNGTRHTVLRGSGVISNTTNSWDIWNIEFSATDIELAAGDTVDVYIYEVTGGTYEPSGGAASMQLAGYAYLNMERENSPIIGSTLLHNTTDGSSVFAKNNIMEGDYSLPLGEAVELYTTNSTSGAGGDVTFRLYYRIMET